MPRRRLVSCLLAFMLFVGMAARGLAAGVLDNVPRDALGFVYIHNLEALDDILLRLMRVSQTVRPQDNIVITPGAVLRATLGGEGLLDEKGDALVALLATDRPLDRPPICAWLPMRDYASFVRKLGGKPDEQITVVTVLGEDLICAHQGPWAVLMDPDQRARLGDLLAGRTTVPPALAPWRTWLDGNECALVLLPTAASRAALRSWIASAPGQTGDNGDEQLSGWNTIFGPTQAEIEAQSMNDDLFGPTGRLNTPAESPSAIIRQLLVRTMKLAPQLSKLAIDADAAAIGLRGDDSKNVLAGLRMAWGNNRWIAPGGADAQDRQQPVMLHHDVEFTISGGGWLPAAMLRGITEAYAESALDELENDGRRPKFDNEELANLRRSLTAAAGDVTTVSVFHALSPNGEGVYTNQFMAVRVSSADAFTSHAADVMRHWNILNQTAEPGTGLAFESQPVTVAGHKAMQHSLDVLAGDNLTDSPEIRQLMERLFGPDRKMHLFVVPIDGKTVLLAQATAEQTAAAANLLTSGKQSGWDGANFAATNRLLPKTADWRFFVSGSGYAKWLKQEQDASPVETIGGPPNVAFPNAPPIGLAGSFPDGQLWIDAVIPAETLEAAGSFFKKRQKPE